MIDSRGFAFKMAAQFHCLFFLWMERVKKRGRYGQGWGNYWLYSHEYNSMQQQFKILKKNKEKSTFSFHYSLKWHISFSTSKA